MAKRLERPLTEVELELMHHIWRLGECTIREVHEALPKERDLAYTSVATMIKILEQKGAVSSQKKDRAITIKPRISRADYEVSSLKHLSESVFEGNPSSMVARLIDTGDLSAEDLKQIKQILEQRLRS